MFSDKEISKIFTQISVTKREAEIKLDETDFYEKKMINKRKKLIMEGKDPDEVEEMIENQKKKRRKEELRKRKEEQKMRNQMKEKSKKQKNESEIKHKIEEENE